MNRLPRDRLEVSITRGRAFLDDPLGYCSHNSVHADAVPSHLSLVPRTTAVRVIFTLTIFNLHPRACAKVGGLGDHHIALFVRSARMLGIAECKCFWDRPTLSEGYVDH